MNVKLDPLSEIDPEFLKNLRLAHEDLVVDARRENKKPPSFGSLCSYFIFEGMRALGYYVFEPNDGKPPVFEPDDVKPADTHVPPEVPPFNVDV
jgi:hypothetical protein